MNTKRSPPLPPRTSPADRRPYTYHPLDVSNKEFRVIELQPGTQDDPAYISFIHCTLNDIDVPYEALSYTWGDPTPTSTIQVITIPEEGDPFEGYALFDTIGIAKNLSLALQAIRSPTEEKTFWIDALCINQNDTKEKNEQVQLMPEIYRSCSKVLAYIGEPLPQCESEKAMDLLSQPISSVPDTKKLLAASEWDDAWRGLTALVQRPYFTRYWITQEIALAPDVQVICGSQTCTWSSLILSLQALNSETYTYVVAKENPQAVENKWIGTALKGWDVPDWHVKQWLEGLRRILALRTARNLAGKISMKNLLTLTNGKCLSNPRDAVYSLLGMSNLTDEYRKKWIVDYEKEIIDVFIDTVDTIVHRTGSLDILCHADVAPHHQHGHSWVPRFAGAFEDCDCEGFLVNSLTISEILVLENGSVTELMMRTSSYDADRGLREKGRVKFDKTNRKLVAEGIVIDVVKNVLDEIEIFRGGIKIPKQWLETALGFSSSSNKSSSDDDRRKQNLETFWRTLVANREQLQIDSEILPCNTETLDDYEEILRFNDWDLYYEHRAPAPRTWIDDCEQWIKGDMTVPDTSSIPFLQALTGYTRHKRYMILGETMALGPIGGKVGDIVCVLIGCSVPVLLRPVKGTLDEFNFVGEAYVHGMMDGEVIEKLEKGEFQVRKFSMI